ncbi:hypothetical protein EJ08DRAFT_680853 [Tothia fuscella]|uniref:J domain-containing protein n=1 Tax=Tothia fuscella TaxID=1048955 RepID=A0A9P4TWJ9_9PEZI|nr:hypothetical protein EJ08DRAFT_680853 [Tothia fuscella]
MSDERSKALETLDLHAGASKEEIRKAWKREALKNHPDKAKEDKTKGDKTKEDTINKFLAVQKAYETLCQPQPTDTEAPSNSWSHHHEKLHRQNREPTPHQDYRPVPPTTTFPRGRKVSPFPDDYPNQTTDTPGYRNNRRGESLPKNYGYSNQGNARRGQDHQDHRRFENTDRPTANYPHAHSRDRDHWVDETYGGSRRTTSHYASQAPQATRDQGYHYSGSLRTTPLGATKISGGPSPAYNQTHSSPRSSHGSFHESEVPSRPDRLPMHGRSPQHYENESLPSKLPSHSSRHSRDKPESSHRSRPPGTSIVVDERKTDLLDDKIYRARSELQAFANSKKKGAIEEAIAVDKEKSHTAEEIRRLQEAVDNFRTSYKKGKP